MNTLPRGFAPTERGITAPAGWKIRSHRFIYITSPEELVLAECRLKKRSKGRFVSDRGGSEVLFALLTGTKSNPKGQMNKSKFF